MTESQQLWGGVGVNALPSKKSMELQCPEPGNGVCREYIKTSHHDEILAPVIIGHRFVGRAGKKFNVEYS